jgi:8-oxo-dGTP pyrophosphatase MutT (NUDIX family)
MMKRHVDSSFGAAYVFPGGVVDATDGDVHEYCSGRTAEQADAALAVDSGGLDYFVAAVRELFEESGVLLADIEASVDELESTREALNNNSQSWTAFVRSTGARMLCDRLHYFSHWITPEPLPKRYSTRFFVAELPDGQVATHDDFELTNSVWISATDALRAGKEGKMKLHYPTLTTLESLAACQSASAILDWARDREARGAETFRPSVPPGATQ